MKDRLIVISLILMIVSGLVIIPIVKSDDNFDKGFIWNLIKDYGGLHKENIRLTQEVDNLKYILHNYYTPKENCNCQCAGISTPISNNGWCMGADLNHDGKVEDNDWSIFLSNNGRMDCS